jgi:tetratricopeptide (TPR) repeat protein
MLACLALLLLAGTLQIQMNFFPRAARKVRTVLFGPPLPAGLAADPTTRELQIRLLKLRDSDEENPELAALYEQQGDRHAEEGSAPLARLEYAIAAQLDRDNPALWQKLGMAYLQQGAAPLAQDAFSKQLQHDPDSASARQGLAMVHGLQGRIEQAIEYAVEAERREPGNVDALLELLALYTHRREIEAADRVAEAALDQDGESAKTLSAVAQAILRFGHPTLAEEYFRRALNADADHLPSLLGLGQILIRGERAAEADEAVQHILSIAPDNVPARALQVEIDRIRYGPHAAIRSLEALQQEFPAESWIPVRLGELHMLTGNFDRAYQSAGELAASTERNAQWDGQWLQTRMFFAQGLYRKALVTGRPLLEQKPLALDVRMLVAQAMLIRGELNAAVSLLNETIRQFPTVHEPYLRLCEALVRLGDPDQAEATINRITEQQEGSAAGIKLKGDYYLLSAGNTERARAAYEEALALEPQNSGLRYDYVHLLAEQGTDLAMAETMARDMVREFPDEPAMRDALGWVLFHQGRVDEALPLLQDAVDHAPQIPVLRHHLSAALAQKELWADAHQHLRIAFALKPSFYGADKARRLLQECETRLSGETE